MIASDANQVLDQPDQQLLNLIPASRSVTIESVGKLRQFCMEFLAACISWDQFRCTLHRPPCSALPCCCQSCVAPSPGPALPCPAVQSPVLPLPALPCCSQSSIICGALPLLLCYPSNLCPTVHSHVLPLQPLLCPALLLTALCLPLAPALPSFPKLSNNNLFSSLPGMLSCIYGGDHCTCRNACNLSNPKLNTYPKLTTASCESGSPGPTCSASICHKDPIIAAAKETSRCVRTATFQSCGSRSFRCSSST